MTTPRTTEDAMTFVVVVNEEEQHALWACNLAVPPGWHHTGVTGSKSDCAQYVDRVWTDMRPLSARRGESA